MSRRRLFRRTAGVAGAIALARAGAEPIAEAGTPRRQSEPSAIAADTIGRIVMYGFGPSSNPNPSSPITYVSISRDDLSKLMEIQFDKDLDQWSDELAGMVKSGAQCHVAIQLFNEPVKDPPTVKTTFDGKKAVFSYFYRNSTNEGFTFAYPIP
jgi:hypothetical protein